MLCSLLGLLATQFLPVDSLAVPAQSDLCNPSLQLCVDQKVRDNFRAIEVIDLDRRAGGGGGKGGKGHEEPIPGVGGTSGGGTAPGGTPGGSTGNGGFGGGDTEGGFGSTGSEGGFGQAAPAAPPVAPKPDPAPEPKPQTGKDDRSVAPVVKDLNAQAILKKWQCGKTKRASPLHRLSRRDPKIYTSADQFNPEKYLEWLNSHADKWPRDKLVFFTTKYNKQTKMMADDLVKANPGWSHFYTVFESPEFMDQWLIMPGPEQDAAKSQAFARYARNPVVFGAAKSMLLAFL